MLKFINKLTKRLEKKKDELEDLLEKGKQMEVNDFYIYLKNHHRALFIFCKTISFIENVLSFAWKIVNAILAIKMVKECSVIIKSFFQKRQGA